MAYREWIEQMERPLVSISKMKTPVIAQVQGVAAANGMGLVASVDIAIAASNVKLRSDALSMWGLNCVGAGDSGGAMRGTKEGDGTFALWPTHQSR